MNIHRYGLLLLLSLLIVACHKNEKLADGDMGPDGDADGIDGDLDTEIEEEAPAMKIDLSKWQTAQGAYVDADSNGIVWTVSRAGIIALDAKGTFTDTSDDESLLHNEITLEGYPEKSPVGACIDGADRLWFATKTGLYLLLPKDSPLDGSDDVLVVPDMTERLTNNREIIHLLCHPTQEGVWLATNFGFAAVSTGETPEDGATWTWNDYRISAASALANRPYAVDIDGAGRLWFTVYLNDTYMLYAVEPGDPVNPADDTEYEVEYGFENPEIGALAADADQGVWIVHAEKAWHLDHKGTLDNGTDDVWVELPSPSSADYSGFFPFAAGIAVGMEKNGIDHFLLSTANTDAPEDDLAAKLDEFGSNEGNAWISATVLDSHTLFYSTELDAGVLVFDGEPSAAAWVRHHYLDLGGVPRNDLAGFWMEDGGVLLGGGNAVTRVAYAAEDVPADFSFTAYELNDPAEATPYDVRTIVKLSDGYLVGGAYLSYMDSEGAFSVWNEASGAPNGVITTTIGPGGAIWVGSYQEFAIPLIMFNVYDTRGSYQTAADDMSYAVESEYFGFVAGAPVDTMVFYDGCKGLIGNTLGLHHYDCNGTATDTTDEIIETGLLDGTRMVQTIRQAGDGTFWVMTLSGLYYTDIQGTATAEDDVIVAYTDLPSPSTGFALDDQGILYYFIEHGLLVHKPNDPANAEDDEAVLFPMRAGSNGVFQTDAENGLWFGYGDGTGVYFARFENLAFRPLADILSEAAASEE